MNQFGGPALFLDRADINTDEIIPGKYLTAPNKQALAAHCLEGLTLPGFDRTSERFRGAKVIVARRNFGAGSSREQAVWALEVNGIRTCIAESYGRIFRQNMFNCGLLAIELPSAELERLFVLEKGIESSRESTLAITVDLNRQLLLVDAKEKLETFHFDLSPFDKALVQSGGWVEFADAHY